jgi:hypothetical protein
MFSEPQTGFRIAFNMFDTDGNQRVDKNEFLVVSTNSGLLQRKRHRCYVSYGVAGAADTAQSWIVPLQGLETACCQMTLIDIKWCRLSSLLHTSVHCLYVFT